MKTPIVCALTCALTLAARAAIVVPGADGSDGVLNITANTVIDLSQAPTGTWDQNNAANAGKGVYDPAKWAVVFKYSSVTVAPNVTVTFKNHASRAPVVWLVNGNVTISGTVSLDGEDGLSGATPLGDRLREGGPGGFRGSSRWISSTLVGSMGFGPGGGGPNAGGSYASAGANNGGVSGSYGNPSLVPLVGGSGGGGAINGSTGSGGGGGGGILVACSGVFLCPGVVTAQGGVGGGSGQSYESSAGGSGGGIRVVAETLQGGGSLSAISRDNRRPGGFGRIRLERVQSAATIQTAPDPSVVPLSAGSTALLWPPTGAPEVKIVSIGGNPTPSEPRASFGTEGADVALPQATAVQAVVETVGVEQAAVVRVRITPRIEKNWSVTSPRVVSATLQQIVSTDPLVIRWVANLPASDGYSAVQAHVVRP